MRLQYFILFIANILFVTNPIKGSDLGQIFASQTLPILHINVYEDEGHSELNNEIIDPNLNHKNYFAHAEYGLESLDNPYLNMGSEENPLGLQIKGRGNWTLRGFAKKPNKLKLDK